MTAIRDAEEKELMLNEIVLDDVLKLDAGDQVVCDAVIIKGNAEVNESFITGEVDAISKKEGENILSGSFIVSGEIYVRVDFAFCLDRFILASEAGVILRCSTELSFIFP